VVAADARSPRDGKFLESIGLYNPLTNPHTVDIKEDRALYWLNNGAEPTATVRSLLSQTGILLRKDLARRGYSEEKVQTELDNWQKLQEVKTIKRTSEKKASKGVISNDKGTEEVKENIEDSTTEVKGATSDESSSEKE
jgi:small subunit ribosomal protein S16